MRLTQLSSACLCHTWFMCMHNTSWPCGHTHRTIPCSRANTDLNFTHVSTNFACYLLVLQATDRSTDINFRPLLEDLSWKKYNPLTQEGNMSEPCTFTASHSQQAPSHSLFSPTFDLTRFFNPRMFNHQISKFVQISVWPFSRPHCSFPPAGSSLSALTGSTLEAPMAAH